MLSWGIRCFSDTTGFVSAIVLCHNPGTLHHRRGLILDSLLQRGSIHNREAPMHIVVSAHDKILGQRAPHSCTSRSALGPAQSQKIKRACVSLKLSSVPLFHIHIPHTTSTHTMACCIHFASRTGCELSREQSIAMTNHLLVV